MLNRVVRTPDLKKCAGEVVVRIDEAGLFEGRVDGELGDYKSDIGAMELYGTPIVGSDPYEVVAAFD